jgi:hypothetical protein
VREIEAVSPTSPRFSYPVFRCVNQFTRLTIYASPWRSVIKSLLPRDPQKTACSHGCRREEGRSRVWAGTYSRRSRTSHTTSWMGRSVSSAPRWVRVPGVVNGDAWLPAGAGKRPCPEFPRANLRGSAVSSSYGRQSFVVSSTGRSPMVRHSSICTTASRHFSKTDPNSEPTITLTGTSSDHSFLQTIGPCNGIVLCWMISYGGRRSGLKACSVTAISNPRSGPTNTSVTRIIRE